MFHFFYLEVDTQETEAVFLSFFFFFFFFVQFCIFFTQLSFLFLHENYCWRAWLFFFFFNLSHVSNNILSIYLSLPLPPLILRSTIACESVIVLGKLIFRAKENDPRRSEYNEKRICYLLCSSKRTSNVSPDYLQNIYVIWQNNLINFLFFLSTIPSRYRKTLTSSTWQKSDYPIYVKRHVKHIYIYRLERSNLFFPLISLLHIMIYLNLFAARKRKEKNVHAIFGYVPKEKKYKKKLLTKSNWL